MSPQEVQVIVEEIVLTDKTIEDLDDDLIDFLTAAWPTKQSQDN